jgi:hypothetical protein
MPARRVVEHIVIQRASGRAGPPSLLEREPIPEIFAGQSRGKLRSYRGMPNRPNWLSNRHCQSTLRHRGLNGHLSRRTHTGSGTPPFGKGVLRRVHRWVPSSRWSWLWLWPKQCRANPQRRVDRRAASLGIVLASSAPSDRRSARICREDRASCQDGRAITM